MGWGRWGVMCPAFHIVEPPTREVTVSVSTCHKSPHNQSVSTESAQGSWKTGGGADQQTF